MFRGIYRGTQKHQGKCFFVPAQTQDPSHLNRTFQCQNVRLGLGFFSLQKLDACLLRLEEESKTK